MPADREIGYYWVGKLYEDCMEWMIAKYIGNGEWTLSGYHAIIWRQRRLSIILSRIRIGRCAVTTK
jgi:hypothetical protein